MPRIYGLWFRRVYGVGLRVWGLGFKVYVLRFTTL